MGPQAKSQCPPREHIPLKRKPRPSSQEPKDRDTAKPQRVRLKRQRRASLGGRNPGVSPPKGSSSSVPRVSSPERSSYLSFQPHPLRFGGVSVLGLLARGTGFSSKGMCLRRGHWFLASGPTFARTVDNADAKYVDTDALGGRVTRTANVTIQPMGPMVSLALPRSSRPTKRRTGIFKSAISYHL